MCSIVGSFNREKFINLIQQNQYRGEFAYSISLYNIYNKSLKQIKDFGLVDIDKIPFQKDDIYYISHLQAPTNGLIKDIEQIHPTTLNNTYLFHNGIIKPRSIKQLQQQYNLSITFDTKLLHYSLSEWQNLNDIEGLFSCIYINDNLYIFRTKHGKLYINDDLDISTEYFNNSLCIGYDKIYKLDMIQNKLILEDEFKTKRYNIIIEGDL